MSDELTPGQAHAVQLNAGHLSGDLLIWTIYSSPSDYPGKFVARPHSVKREVALRCHLIADTLDEIREKLPFGLAQLDRSPGDDATIVETWI